MPVWYPDVAQILWLSAEFLWLWRLYPWLRIRYLLYRLRLHVFGSWSFTNVYTRFWSFIKIFITFDFISFREALHQFWWFRICVLNDQIFGWLVWSRIAVLASCISVGWWLSFCALSFWPIWSFILLLILLLRALFVCCSLILFCCCLFFSNHLLYWVHRHW